MQEGNMCRVLPFFILYIIVLGIAGFLWRPLKNRSIPNCFLIHKQFVTYNKSRQEVYI